MNSGLAICLTIFFQIYKINSIHLHIFIFTHIYPIWILLDYNISIKVITRSKSRFPLNQLSQGLQMHTLLCAFQSYGLGSKFGHYILLSLIFILAVLIYSLIQSSSVQSLSHVWLFVTPWTAAHLASLSITNSQSLLKLMSIESVMPSNHFILSSPSPPAFNLSQHQGLFKSVSASHQVAKVLELQLQHQTFQWIFRTDFL